MKCWYCGSKELKPMPGFGKQWLKCSKCGATTDTNPAKLGSEVMVRRRDVTLVGDEKRVLHSGSPGSRKRKRRPHEATL